MKKINVLVAMLALALFAAVPAFALEIEVGEGSVTITDTTTVTDSIVQSCEASVTFGDENANVQVVENAQNAEIEGGSVSQSISQSGFNPSSGTGCTQEVAQAAAAG